MNNIATWVPISLAILVFGGGMFLVGREVGSHKAFDTSIDIVKDELQKARKEKK